MTIDASDPAEAAWLDREDDKVESVIAMIRVYQFKMPDGIGPWRNGPWPRDWWSQFWDRLEHTREERDHFLTYWRIRNQPGGCQMAFEDFFDGGSKEWHPYFMEGQRKIADYCTEGSA